MRKKLFEASDRIQNVINDQLDESIMGNIIAAPQALYAGLKKAAKMLLNKRGAIKRIKREFQQMCEHRRELRIKLGQASKIITQYEQEFSQTWDSASQLANDIKQLKAQLDNDDKKLQRSTREHSSTKDFLKARMGDIGGNVMQDVENDDLDSAIMQLNGVIELLKSHKKIQKNYEQVASDVNGLIDEIGKNKLARRKMLISMIDLIKKIREIDEIGYQLLLALHVDDEMDKFLNMQHDAAKSVSLGQIISNSINKAKTVFKKARDRFDR